MHSSLFFLGVHIILAFLHLEECECWETCDRRPLGITTDPLPPDNQFLIEIDGIRDNLYIPKQRYTVRLHSREPKSTFIAFSISLQPDTVANSKNPRKGILLKAGRLELSPESPDTKYSPICNDTISEKYITAKTSVSVIWTAPDKDQKCVTIFAVVAVKPDVWYSFEGPLHKRVCEDRRKADDMQPMVNNDCRVCEDARYQLTFEGMWSYNTHPYMYPNEKHLARFSDIVGASHSPEYILYKNDGEASRGLRMLAEQGNSTELELEIQRDLGGNVRTVIKATAPPEPNLSTISSFRVTRKHHLVSLATAMLPSPDWFLGVANFELCHVGTKMWTNDVSFNLYPLDAGTDKGLTFESANEETSPPQPITSLTFKDKHKEDIKPFARLKFTLVRTYPKLAKDCSDTRTDETTETDPNADGEGDDDGQDSANESTSVPEMTSEETAPVDPTASPECPVSEWGEWGPCEDECVDGHRDGYRTRFRHYLGRVSEECMKNFPTDEHQHCEEECQIEEETEEPTDATAD